VGGFYRRDDRPYGSINPGTVYSSWVEYLFYFICSIFNDVFNNLGYITATNERLIIE
jgi:hypothetical protein